VVAPAIIRFPDCNLFSPNDSSHRGPPGAGTGSNAIGQRAFGIDLTTVPNWENGLAPLSSKEAGNDYRNFPE
jgi:hypothetical protein